MKRFKKELSKARPSKAKREPSQKRRPSPQTSALPRPHDPVFRPVRVEMKESAPPLQDPWPPVTIDLFIDSNDRRAGHWLVFGWQGDPEARDKTCWPFVISKKGEVDFGDGWENRPSRIGSTDLFNGPIRQGRLVSFGTTAEGISQYRITRVIRLDQLSIQGT